MDCRSAIGQVLLHFVAFVILSNVASKVEGCHLSCDFEESLCDYEQSTDDDGDWKRVTGENPTSDTGPSSDHTTGGGSYVYFESPDPEKEGEFADLRGPIVQDFKQECLGFYYHMKGSDMDSLEVLTYKDKDGSASLYSLRLRYTDRALRYHSAEIRAVVRPCLCVVNFKFLRRLPKYNVGSPQDAIHDCVDWHSRNRATARTNAHSEAPSRIAD